MEMIHRLVEESENNSLSMKELGLLAYLTEYAPCELSVEEICDFFGEGKTAVRSALHALESKKLVFREQKSNGSGGSKTIYSTIFDLPR